jgi:hypothetical protein
MDQELKKEIEKQTPQPIEKWRQFNIETNGSDIRVAKNECTSLEIRAILMSLLNKLNQQ